MTPGELCRLGSFCPDFSLTGVSDVGRTDSSPSAMPLVSKRARSARRVPLLNRRYSRLPPKYSPTSIFLSACCPVEARQAYVYSEDRRVVDGSAGYASRRGAPIDLPYPVRADRGDKHAHSRRWAWSVMSTSTSEC